MGRLKKIAICMPYFERMGPLRKTLSSFVDVGYLEHDFPYEVSISVCDDGSTKEPVPREWNKYPMSVSWLISKHSWKNPCVAINKAVRQTDAEFILLQGPETRHEGNILSPMMERLEDSDRRVVLGPIVGPDVPARTPFWWCQLMHRSFFDEIGGFDEEFRKGKGGEDTDFYNRLLLAGAEFIRFMGPPHARRQPRDVSKWEPHRYPTGHKNDPNCKRLIKIYGQTHHIRPKDRDKIRARLER